MKSITKFRPDRDSKYLYVPGDGDRPAQIFLVVDTAALNELITNSKDKDKESAQFETLQRLRADKDGFLTQRNPSMAKHIMFFLTICLKDSNPTLTHLHTVYKEHKIQPKPRNIVYNRSFLPDGSSVEGETPEAFDQFAQKTRLILLSKKQLRDKFGKKVMSRVDRETLLLTLNEMGCFEITHPQKFSEKIQALKPASEILEDTIFEKAFGKKTLQESRILPESQSSRSTTAVDISTSSQNPAYQLPDVENMQRHPLAQGYFPGIDSKNVSKKTSVRSCSLFPNPRPDQKGRKRHTHPSDCAESPSRKFARL